MRKRRCGKLAPGYKNGDWINKHYCKEKECNNEICYETWKNGLGRCYFCASKNRKRKGLYYKGKFASYYKDGRCLKKHYCIEPNCNKEITMQTALYGKGRCASCAGKNKKDLLFYKVPHGNGEYYKNNWMRSSWEIVFAKFLDLSGYKWLYEPKAFDLDNTTYTPDFYIPEFNCYIEIKGWWRDDAKIKFNAFKKKYPNKNIKVLRKKDLQELGVL